MATAADVVKVDESATGTAVYTTEKVDTLLNGKANTSLNNLDEAGKSVIKTMMADELAKKADKTALDTKANTSLDNLNDTGKSVIKTTMADELAKKADATELNDKANTNLSNLTEAGKSAIKNTMSADMDSKANKADVYSRTDADDKFATKDALNGKADQTALNQATDRITANEAAITGLTKKTTDQQTAIDDLKKKTAEISHEDGEGTKISGVTIKDGNIVGNGNSAITQLANVGTDKINGKSLAGTTVATEKEVKDVADAVKTETDERKAADTELEGKITKNSQDIATLDGKVTTAQGDIQTNANSIQTNSNAIADTNKRTGGIKRNIEDTQTTIENKVTVNGSGDVGGVKGLSAETINTTGDAAIGGKLNVTGASDLKGDVTLGTPNGTNTVTVNGTANFYAAAKMNNDLTVTGDTNLGNTTVDGNLKVTGTITTDKMVFGDKATNNYTEIDHGKVTSTNLEVRAGQAISSSSTFDVEKNEVGFGNGITDEQSSHKQTSDVITDTVKNNNTGDQSFHKQTSDVIMDNVKDGKNSNNRTQTKTETKDIITDENGNSSTTSQTASQNKTYLKDKDGKNTNSTIDTAKEYDKTIKGENGKTSTKQTATDITNTAEAGTIKNTAKNVTNEGTESVTNTVGGNEVKVSKDGVDIKAEAGKKIKESVGTASRVVENDKITDNAGDSTVTTENGKGTTFGKEGSTGTTNIYEDSIKTGKINAKDTTTDKLTAGAAADADGGRLTVDADGGVKGSYKSGDYTSRSYILANTLKSGVDNGKKPTEDGFVGSRTDHYMAGDKAKLDETVKDADGSNVTNKTSTGTVTTITDDTTTTKTEQGVKDITNTAKNGTITNDAKDIVNIAKDTITNTAGTSITNQVNDSKVTTDANGTTFENNTPAVSDGGATTTQINGNQITTGRVDANELGVSDKDDQGNTADLSVKAGEGIKSSATDKDGNTTYTKVTATENSFQVQDKDGKIKNHQVNTKDSSENTITNGDKTNTVTSTADGTTFNNSKANTAFEGGKYTDTTIKGNTITTGKVTMDYADVMKDLGVNGNAKIDGKTTTGSLEVKGESKLTGDVTMGSNATVNGNFNVEGNTNLKNTKVDGTLKVTQMATFDDSVSIAKDLSVDGNATIKGDVTARSYKVDGKTYISAAGINANDQKITNVADGSISEGSKDAVNGGQLYDVKRDMEHKVDKVGANAAAMANLRPMEFDPSSKWNIAAAIGNYGSETAAALGAFYRPNDDVMVNLSTAFGTGENMVGGGVSVRLGKGGNKLSREESNALKDQVNDLTARMDALLSVLNPNMSKDFPDVPENHWAYEAVSRLAGNDIVQGYPDGEFHGERTMTRYEMAEIIYNALSRGAEAERELVEEFKPELQAMAASEKATAERAEG